MSPTNPATPCAADDVQLIRHRPGALGLRLGLGPAGLPLGAVGQLKRLLDQDSFWAQGRSEGQLRRMLAGSDAAVTAWTAPGGPRGPQAALVGFGRATSDGPFRGVIWDVVVADSHRGQGIGSRLVHALLKAPRLAQTERVYLMTTRGLSFYRQLGFEDVGRQHLLVITQESEKTSG